MKSINRAIDRFCYKHPKFGVNNLMLYIIIGNVIVYLFSAMDRTGTFLSYLYLNPLLIIRGQVWRIFTFIFIPYSDSILATAISLYFYYFIGSTLERYWGSGRFTIYYIFGIIFTAIYGLIYCLLTKSPYIYLDSVYINLSMFFAFATLFPDTQVLLFFIIPIKIKWLAIVDALFFVWSIITSPFPYCLLPVIAIANFLIFCGGFFIDMAKRSGSAGSKTARNFRSEAKRAKYEADNQPYRHKCAVCGRTDVSNPELEFRYCSQCEGYHCFCQDHINNHIHFK